MQFRVAVGNYLHFCDYERRLSSHTLQAYESDLTDFARWLRRPVGADGPGGGAPSNGAAVDGNSDLAEGADAADPANPDLATLTATTLKAYLEWMVAGRGLSAATVRRRMACLRSFFRYCEEAGLAESPFASWHPQLPRRRRLPRTLSRGEAASLVSTIKAPAPGDDPDLSTAMLLMVATGVRVGELCRLQVEDVAPDGASLRIYGKGARDRIAYVADPALRRALARLVTRRRLAPAPAALFANRSGSAIKPQAVRERLRRLAVAAGLSRRVTPHMLRHTAATLLIETGVDIRFVQRLLGHSSIATTEIYTHVSDEALRRSLVKANILSTLAGGSA